jgi:hypothetical protein
MRLLMALTLLDPFARLATERSVSTTHERSDLVLWSVQADDVITPNDCDIAAT